MIAGAQTGLAAPDERVNAQTPAIVNGPKTRFTLDGDQALEAHLEQSCARVLSGVRGLIPKQKLEAVLLGGGYGRGEGGVLRLEEGDRPYNDLEFYVAMGGNRHINEILYQQRLHVLGEILTQLVGIEVEFKITSLAEIASRPVSMFSYDLAVGHRLIWGSEEKAISKALEGHRAAEKIPWEEAIRLLMNRCSGLLLSRQKLSQTPFTPSAADFVRRNIAKLQLAMGDALLTVDGRYHSSCVERHNHLLEGQTPADSASWFADVVCHHAAGVKFKLHPERGGYSHESLLALYLEVSELARHCWLWIEERRLNRPFISARSYALDAADKTPHTSSLRNLLLNLRIDGARACFRRSSLRHPRQRIFRVLPLLLWEPSALVGRAERGEIQLALNAKPTDFNQALSAYSRVWNRVH